MQFEVLHESLRQVRQKAEDVSMQSAKLRVCDYDTGVPRLQHPSVQVLSFRRVQVQDTCEILTGKAPLDRPCEAEAGPFDGVEQVPVEGCKPRSQDAPGVDFMTGGLPGQATQDPAA